MANSQNQILVDFMILGSMKSGTSTLAQILANHPEVCFSARKEPDFFATSQDWRGELPEYNKLFSNPEAKVYGEASTSYTSYPEYNLKIWDDLYEYNPNLKFIYIMRNPISRVVSQYMHLYLRGRTNANITQAIKEMPTIINRGRYYTQIIPFIERFGRDRIYLLTMEDFLKDKPTHLLKIADFLGIDSTQFNHFDSVHANETVGNIKADYRVQTILESRFFKWLERLLPKYVWRKFTNGIYLLTSRRINERVEIPDATSKMVLHLLKLDLIEIEKLMGRHITEWKLPFKADLKAADRKNLEKAEN
ncbi:MAG: sulfotransferase [Microscillaceae bacterium]|jgi:hypothetical protein|nr:sulfotransferase [Microscillaceae bacterium]